MPFANRNEIQLRLQAVFADKFGKSFSAKRSKEVGVNFALILGMSQQQPKLPIFKISSKMTYFLLEIMNLAVQSAWYRQMMMIQRHFIQSYKNLSALLDIQSTSEASLYMMHKTKEDISHEYLAELKQGSFHVLTLSTVFFLYSAYQTHSKISSKNRDVDAISSVCLNLLMSKW